MVSLVGFTLKPAQAFLMSSPDVIEISYSLILTTPSPQVERGKSGTGGYSLPALP